MPAYNKQSQYSEQQQELSTHNNNLSPYYANKEYINSPIYRNFLNSIKAPKTKAGYEHKLFKYYLSRPKNQGLTLEDIIKKDTKLIEYEILDIIYEMKEKHQLSYSSIHLFLAVIVHFFEINDVTINRRKLNRFKGDNIAKYEYRSYTHEEIQNLISSMDERGKVAVLLMASTGMRVGALPELRLKHLKRWEIDSVGTHIYQITVYGNSPKHRYFTFCTPECAKTIDSYLEFRKIHGENIKQDPQTKNWIPGESFLVIKQFDKEKHRQRYSSISPDLGLTSFINKPVSARTISISIILRLEKCGKRERVQLIEGQAKTTGQRQSIFATHRNEVHPSHSLRIFAVTNMQRAKLDKTIREMLVGHSTGLDKAYYKPQDDEILQEYLKAVDLLTISNENRLKKQIDFYKQREDDLSRMSIQLAEIKEKLGI